MNNRRQTDTRPTEPKQELAPRYERIKLGLDVHAEWIVVVRIVDGAAPQPAQRFTWTKFLEWVKTQLGQAGEVHSCYEAGPFGYGLHRALSALGVKNHVVQAVSLDERHTGVKTDKTDARELALRLDRYVAGNTRAMAPVRVPTPEEESRRAQARQREQLKRETQRVAAMGRSLLLTQGFREKGEWWKSCRWAGLSRQLPGWLVEQLEVFRGILEVLEAKLVERTRALTEASAQPRPKGMGPLSLETLDREVGDWGRFGNRRQVGSYMGLCGGVSSSGNTTRLLSITKHGNARMRTVLIEAAWRLVKWQPQCPLVRRWWKLLGSAKGPRGARKKAIVAIARQLAVDLWRWRTGRESAAQLGWVMIAGPSEEAATA